MEVFIGKSLSEIVYLRKITYKSLISKWSLFQPCLMEGFPPKPPSSDLEVRSKPLGLEDEMGQIVFGYLLHIEKWIFLVDVPMNKGDFP